MSKLKKLIIILMGLIISTFIFGHNVEAVSSWYDFYEQGSDYIMGEEGLQAGLELIGDKVSFAGEGSDWYYQQNIGCIDPTTGLGGTGVNYICAGMIDINRRYWNGLLCR